MNKLEFINHLSYYYAGSLQQFIDVICSAGFPEDHLSTEQTPQKNFSTFVQACKGLALDKRKKIFKAMAKDKEGSTVFKEIAESNIEYFDDVLVSISGEQYDKDIPTGKIKKPKFSKRRLTQKQAESILKGVLELAKNHHICDQEPAVHAVAAAIGYLTAQTAVANLTLLRDELDVCFGDSYREGQLTRKKVEKHIGSLFEVRTLLAQITEKRRSNTGRNVNYLNKIFTKLPGGKSLLENKLRTILRLLDKLIKNMRKELDEIYGSNGSGANRQKAIRALLNKNAAKIWKLRNRLDGLLDKLHETAIAVVRDWNIDLSMIEYICRSA